MAEQECRDMCVCREEAGMKRISKRDNLHSMPRVNSIQHNMSLLDKYLENACYVSGTVIGTKCTVL